MNSAPSVDLLSNWFVISSDAFALMPNPPAGVELNVPELAVAVRVSPPEIVDPDAKSSKSAWACPALVLLPNVKVCADTERLNAAIVMRVRRGVCGFIFV
jgi:hypothetical protein